MLSRMPTQHSIGVCVHQAEAQQVAYTFILQHCSRGNIAQLFQAHKTGCFWVVCQALNILRQ